MKIVMIKRIKMIIKKIKYNNKIKKIFKRKNVNCY